MHFLFTDESNLNPRENVKFFTYGGLIIEANQLRNLHDRIEAIRTQYGYTSRDQLKFDTHVRPTHLSVEDVTNAKQAVVQACIECNCLFIAYVVLHAIARNTPINDTIMWGANQVIGKFNYFLEQNNSHGVVAVDRLPHGAEFQYLAEKFTGGLTLQDGEVVALNRISLFTSTCVNASHASSAMDIVLGSWRYCINQPYNVDAARVMMDNLTKLIWCERDGNRLLAFEKGLIFRPRNVGRQDYAAEYTALLNHINGLLERH
jgi:hypothetical protein